MKSAAARGGVLLVALAGLAAPQPAAAQSDIVLLGASAPTRAGKWAIYSDSSASSGKVIRHPNANASKNTTADSSPANYFEMTFTAEAGKPYRLWIRGKADSNYWANDSVFVQFDKSVTSSGSATTRIGTTSAAEVNLEECSGCGISGWEWQDNGYGRGILGPKIYFASSGTQRMRVQTREDGLAIDQILLSPSTYLNAAPSSVVGDGSATAPASTTASEIVLQASAASVKAGKWAVASDSTAVGGKKIRHPDANAAKIITASASPANYFELTFDAVAGKPYRLWLHGRADDDDWANDSVFVQFDRSVTSSGSATFRIGTTSATEVNLEEHKDAGLDGWMWQDNGWGKGVLGPVIYFSTTGPQRMRVQTREDGLSVDQILLSPSKYLTSRPPAPSGSTPAPAPAPAPTPEPEPEPEPTGSTTTLKVLTWNIHHGIGTDGRYDLNRFGTWMGKWKPDVVMITEAEKFVGGYGNEDQPLRFKQMLEAQTGRKWYYLFAQEYGNWSSNGKGNLLLSRYPFTSTGRDILSWDRTVAAGVIAVNGRNISIMATHLDHESKTRRHVQAGEVITVASQYVGPHIIAGDFNAWPDQSSIDVMTAKYYDSWAVAEAGGDASSFSGNSPFGATKNGRIDYIFYSRANSSFLKVVKSQVPDTRDSRGVMPSDHRPVLTTFEVR